MHVPRDREADPEQAAERLGHPHERVAAALLVRRLDLLPVLFQKEDGLLELVVLAPAASVFLAVRTGAELGGDLLQLRGALVEQHSLLRVLFQVERLWPSRVFMNQVHGQGHEADAREDGEEEPADEGEERDDIDGEGDRDA